MAIEINIIKEDIKKDLTNFLIGISQAGISEDIFPDLVEMITKSLSPTLDVAQFTDNLIELLKRGNDVKDGKGVDFAPLIESLQRGSPFLGADGDSVLISTKAISDPKGKVGDSYVREIDDFITSENDNKADSTIEDDNGEDFVSTSDVEGKEEEDVPNITQGAVTDPSVGDSIDDFVTSENDNKADSTLTDDNGEDFVTTSNTDDNTETKIEPFKDNTLSAYEGDGTGVDEFVTSDGDDKTEKNLNVISQRNSQAISGSTRYGSKEEVLIEGEDPVQSLPEEIKISDQITQAATEITDFANKTPRRQKQLEILLYNAIPYGITQKIAGLTNIVNGLANEGNYDTIFGSGQLSINQIASGALGIMKIVTRAKYLSALELGLYTSGAINFYTIQFRRGITIKDMRITSSFGPGIPFTVGAVESTAYLKSEKLKVFGAPPADRIGEVIRSLFPGMANLVDDIKEIQKKIEELTNNPKKFDDELLKYHPDNLLDTARVLEKEVSPKSYAEDPVDVKKDNETEITINTEGGTASINFSVRHPKHGDLQDETFKFGTLNDEYKKQELTTRLDNKHGIWEVGCIYIWPITDDQDVSPKYVPFQFNPTITEAGMVARYTATSILSRIGNLQSFVGVDSLTVTLNTAYFPTSNSETENFSMGDIQLIELAYRSLTLPWFSDTKSDSGYKYYKPPLVKVIMGDKKAVNDSVKGLKTTNAPYSNLLTYPDDVLNGKRNNEENRHFKTFIATSVVIARTDDMPYFMEEQDDGKYLLKDTFGYNVSMSLTEVTPSYHQILPNFKDYFNKYIQ